jgi:hypothetical protein
MEDFNEKPKIRQTRTAPVLGPVKATLDEWIKEDLKKKKKFRRTAKSKWELLKIHHDFKGSDRTVREYFSLRRKSSSTGHLRQLFHLKLSRDLPRLILMKPSCLLKEKRSYCHTL